MKNCENIQELLGPYIDNELDTTKVEQVKMHLTECAACRELLTAYESIDDLTTKAYDYDPGEEYWDTFNLRLHQRMERRAARPAEASGLSSVLTRLFTLPVMRVAVVVAPVVLVALVGVFIYQNQLDQKMAVQPSMEVASNQTASGAETQPAQRQQDVADPSEAMPKDAAEAKTDIDMAESTIEEEAMEAPAPAQTARRDEAMERAQAEPTPPQEPVWATSEDAATSEAAASETGMAARPTPESAAMTSAAPYYKTQAESAEMLADEGTAAVSQPQMAMREIAKPPGGNSLRSFLENDYEDSFATTDPTRSDGMKAGKAARSFSGQSPTMKDDRTDDIPDMLLDQVRVVKEQFIHGTYNGQFATGVTGPSLAGSYGIFPAPDNVKVLKTVTFEDSSLIFTEFHLPADFAVSDNTVVTLENDGTVAREIKQLDLQQLRGIASSYINRHGQNLFRAADALANQTALEPFPFIDRNSDEQWTLYDFFWNPEDAVVWVRFHSALLPSTRITTSHYLGDYGVLWLQINPSTSTVEAVLLSRTQVVVWE